MTFLQAKDLVPSTDSVAHDGVTCYGCQSEGYYRDKWPGQDVTQLLQYDKVIIEHVDKVSYVEDLVEVNTVEIDVRDSLDPYETELLGEDDVFVSFSFLQPPCAQCCLIKPTLILLDSKATLCTFDHPGLVSNVRYHECGNIFDIYTNSGSQLSTLVTDYPKLRIPVWFNNNSLANVISLAVVKKKHQVTMDTSKEVVMHVHIYKKRSNDFLRNA